MKNNFRTNVVAMGLFLMLAIATVNAQTPTGAEVSIPFDFTAGKANLKAGSYTITRVSEKTLKIRSADGENSVLVNAPLTIGARDFKSGERLVFNRYGNDYFLTQVWLTIEQGRQLFPSRAEQAAARELANHGTKPTRVDIAVRTK